MNNREKKMMKSILVSEGGYSSNPYDAAHAGGLDTYRGITRKNFPNWEGWTIVDKNKPLRQNQIIKNDKLEHMVMDFYYKEFYLRNKIDKIKNDLLAAHTLDHCVNAGHKNGVRTLQRAINAALNTNISVDGIIGNITLNLCNGSKSDDIAKEMIRQRKNYYERISQIRPQNKRFLGGWFKRVDRVTKEFSSNGIFTGFSVAKSGGFISKIADLFESLGRLVSGLAKLK